ncbi:hypothetical protein IGI04_039300 [Brassica rapa subsp. trilocularis]|uniref:F-box domain-containing protein n=2 Tax=Brassica campestris TaxID=3711 RepID=A0A8D9I484_BRACM|nr:hypothetical protein IGI04_039300 [Brassica rapa subsp. trilocularis]CAG7908944.1 unnamed protein product [Brassica rapa]
MKPPRQNVCGTRRVTRSMTSPQQISLPIPAELVFEIFSRLPSKVIARCRCVCKLWSSMLCRQYFIESFLTKSCARPQILFSCEAKFDICFWSVPQPQNQEGNSSAVAAANHLAPFRRYSRFFGCANGLFVCGYEGVKNDSKVVTVICNPSTGQSLTLPRLKSRTRYEVETYLGYDPIAKEYKVLSMAFSRVNNVYISVDHQVLTLGTKRLSWRKVQCCIPHLPSSSIAMYICGHLPSSSMPICISGVLYYKAGAPCISSVENIVESMVVCFDLRTEKFGSVKFLGTSCKEPTLVNHNGKLGLLMSGDSTYVNLERRSRSFELWVLRDAEWSKHVYVLPPSWKNIVTETMRIIGMIGNEIVLSLCNQNEHLYVIYYNVESKMITKVGVQGMDVYQGCYLKTYLNYVEDVKFF